MEGEAIQSRGLSLLIAWIMGDKPSKLEAIERNIVSKIPDGIKFLVNEQHRLLLTKQWEKDGLNSDLIDKKIPIELLKEMCNTEFKDDITELRLISGMRIYKGRIQRLIRILDGIDFIQRSIRMTTSVYETFKDEIPEGPMIEVVNKMASPLMWLYEQLSYNVFNLKKLRAKNQEFKAQWFFALERENLVQKELQKTALPYIKQ